MKSKLFHRDFNLMVVGQIVSILGSAILRFALELYILDITGRADIFAIVLAISAIPTVILSPIGGAIADRFNRRNLMVIFDFCSSAIVVLLMLMLHTGNSEVWMLTVILVLLAVISAMYQPAVQASIPLLAREEHLAQANGIVTGVSTLSALMGPVMGGVLYGVLGLNMLIVISAVAFFLSAVMEIFIRIPFVKPEQKGHIIAAIGNDIKYGISYMTKKNTYILKIIIIAALLNMLMAPMFIVGVPYILRITMESSDIAYGIGMGLMQVSSIVGALMMGFFSKKMSMNTLYKWLLATVIPFVPMAVAVTPWMLAVGYWPSTIIFFLFGAIIMMLVSVVSIYTVTEVQRKTPNELLGKIMAIAIAASQCAAPVGQLIYGQLFKVFSNNVFIPVLLAAFFTLLIGMMMKRMKM